MSMQKPKITVERLEYMTFSVTVETNKTTTHKVTCTPGFYNKMTHGRVTEERLVQISFEFLLDKIAGSAIKKEFDLPWLQRMFDDYETEVFRRM
jgi:hypothetical protein